MANQEHGEPGHQAFQELKSLVLPGYHVRQKQWDERLWTSGGTLAQALAKCVSAGFLGQPGEVRSWLFWYATEHYTRDPGPRLTQPRSADTLDPGNASERRLGVAFALVACAELAFQHREGTRRHSDPLRLNLRQEPDGGFQPPREWFERRFPDRAPVDFDWLAVNRSQTIETMRQLLGDADWVWGAVRTLQQPTGPGVAQPRAVWTPVVGVDPKGQAMVHTLVVEVLRPGQGKVSRHLRDAFDTEPLLDKQFAHSMRNAFEMALAEVHRGQTGPERSLADGRWRLLQGWKWNAEERKQLRPLVAPAGASASGAAARLWWQALSGKVSDERVIVIAQANDPGQIAAVDAEPIGPKLEVVLRAVTEDSQRGWQHFDTVALVSANCQSARDTLEAAAASPRRFSKDLFEVVDIAQPEKRRNRATISGRSQPIFPSAAEASPLGVPATLSQLLTVRSQLAEQVEDYCMRLVERLDKTPWFRGAENITASTVAVPVRVLKESPRPKPARAALLEPARELIDPEMAALYEEAGREKGQEEVPWPDEVSWLQEQSKVRRAVVLGGPGSGKSFLTQTTTFALARATLTSLRQQRDDLNNLVLPIYLNLARWADPGQSRDPAEPVLQALDLELRAVPAFRRWLEARLPSHRTWLILDALDEVREEHRPALTQWLSALEAHAWQSRVLLTCRPANYAREQVPWPDLVEYELALFSTEEIRHFVRRWFEADPGRGQSLVQVLDRSYPVAHAARVPLLATFLCLAHEEVPVTTTTRRVDLYGRVVRGLARRAWKEPGFILANENLHVEDLIQFLVRIAKPLFQLRPNGNLFTHAEVWGTLNSAPGPPAAWLQGREVANTPANLRAELLETGVLVGAGLRDGAQTQFSFAHRSFLEYLVARNLTEETQERGWGIVAPLLEEKSWDPAWQETILFMAGLLTDSRPLLALLVNAQPDQFHTLLLLAGRALLDLGADRVDRALAESITREIFETLWRDNPPGHDRCDTALALAHPRGLDLLAGDLGHWDWRVRIDAARSLGRIGSDSSVGNLSERLKTEPERTVRRSVENALRRIGSLAAEAALRDAGVAWKECEARALEPGTPTRTGEVAQAVPGRELSAAALIAALDVAERAEERLEILRVLVSFRDERVFDKVRAVLGDDPDPAVRGYAASVLPRLLLDEARIHRVEAALCTGLMHEHNDEVQCLIVGALGKTGRDRAADALLAWLKSQAEGLRAADLPPHVEEAFAALRKISRRIGRRIPRFHYSEPRNSAKEKGLDYAI